LFLGITIKMLHLVQKYLPNVKHKQAGKDQTVITCPFHAGGAERTPSLFINNINGLWYCQGCKIGGGFKKFLKELGVAREDIDVDTRELNSAMEAYKEKKEFEKQVLFYIDPFVARPILAETVLLKFVGTPKQLIDIGFNEEVLKRYEVGFDELRQRIIYPVRDVYGNLAGVSGGTVIGAEPKYRLYPGRMLIKDKWVTSPFGEEFDQQYPAYTPDDWKKQCLWNFDRVYAACLYSTKVETIIIVEGFKAALWLIQNGYKNTIALMGSSVSELQYTLLSRLNCRYLVMTDNDKAGDTCAHNLLLSFAGITPIARVDYTEYHQPDDIPPKDLHIKIIKCSQGLASMLK
jgi:DNA primase